jgi:hypothetical protein
MGYTPIIKYQITVIAVSGAGFRQPPERLIWQKATPASSA